MLLNRLPERAYLYSILKQLEVRLSFPVGSLDPFLPPVSEDDFKEHRFTLGSIDAFHLARELAASLYCHSFLLNRAFYGQRLSSHTLLFQVILPLSRQLTACSCRSWPCSAIELAGRQCNAFWRFDV